MAMTESHRPTNNRCADPGRFGSAYLARLTVRFSPRGRLRSKRSAELGGTKESPSRDMAWPVV